LIDTKGTHANIAAEDGMVGLAALPGACFAAIGNNPQELFCAPSYCCRAKAADRVPLLTRPDADSRSSTPLE
jgi:hypothetical protein